MIYREGTIYLYKYPQSHNVRISPQGIGTCSLPVLLVGCRHRNTFSSSKWIIDKIVLEFHKATSKCAEAVLCHIFPNRGILSTLVNELMKYEIE